MNLAMRSFGNHKPRLAILDCGAGNLASIVAATSTVGFEPVVTSDRAEIESADAILLPGVGAFGAAMAGIRAGGLEPLLKDLVTSWRPILGICLGMQLLMDESLEHGRHRGLGIVHGDVVRFDNSSASFKVPHMGWNRLRPVPGSASTLVTEECHCYFMHSYYIRPQDSALVTATANYGGVDFCAVLELKNLRACQFHPERSGTTGLAILRKFAALVRSRSRMEEVAAC